MGERFTHRDAGEALEAAARSSRIDWHVWIKWWSECPDRARFLDALSSELRAASSGSASTSAATVAVSGSPSAASVDDALPTPGEEPSDG